MGSLTKNWTAYNETKPKVPKAKTKSIQCKIKPNIQSLKIWEQKVKHDQNYWLIHHIR